MPFHKLSYSNMKYFIDNNLKVAFHSNSNIINSELLNKSFEFAYNMAFTPLGSHRTYRSGGTMRRRNSQIFANTFQGKLAECAVYTLFQTNNIPTSEIDFNTYNLGEWDIEDININGKHISVKSTKSYSQLLLLETKDYNIDGTYIPNKIIYDYYILVRFNTFIEDILKQNKLLYTDNIEKELLYSLINKSSWAYDIPGFLSHDSFIQLINENNIIHKNNYLNTTSLDADNYYCLICDLENINSLIEMLK